MKYIRTKDGIFEFAKRFDLEHYKKVGFSDEDIIRKFIRNGNKIANTIPELCDEFVAIYKDENKSARVLETFGDYRQLDEKQLIYNIKNGWHIYGAIWTAKGLIYVAKMDDKGDLELL